MSRLFAAYQRVHQLFNADFSRVATTATLLAHCRNVEVMGGLAHDEGSNAQRRRIEPRLIALQKQLDRCTTGVAPGKNAAVVGTSPRRGGFSSSSSSSSIPLPHRSSVLAPIIVPSAPRSGSFPSLTWITCLHRTLVEACIAEEWERSCGVGSDAARTCLKDGQEEASRAAGWSVTADYSFLLAADVFEARLRLMLRFFSQQFRYLFKFLPEGDHTTGQVVTEALGPIWHMHVLPVALRFASAMKGEEATAAAARRRSSSSASAAGAADATVIDNTDPEGTTTMPIAHTRALALRNRARIFLAQHYCHSEVEESLENATKQLAPSSHCGVHPHAVRCGHVTRAASELLHDPARVTLARIWTIAQWLGSYANTLQVCLARWLHHDFMALSQDLFSCSFDPHSHRRTVPSTSAAGRRNSRRHRAAVVLTLHEVAVVAYHEAFRQQFGAHRPSPVLDGPAAANALLLRTPPPPSRYGSIRADGKMTVLDMWLPPLTQLMMKGPHRVRDDDDDDAGSSSSSSLTAMTEDVSMQFLSELQASLTAGTGDVAEGEDADIGDDDASPPLSSPHRTSWLDPAVDLTALCSPEARVDDRPLAVNKGMWMHRSHDGGCRLLLSRVVRLITAIVGDSVWCDHAVFDGLSTIAAAHHRGAGQRAAVAIVHFEEDGAGGIVVWERYVQQLTLSLTRRCASWLEASFTAAVVTGASRGATRVVASAESAAPEDAATNPPAAAEDASTSTTCNHMRLFAIRSNSTASDKLIS